MKNKSHSRISIIKVTNKGQCCVILYFLEKNKTVNNTFLQRERKVII